MANFCGFAICVVPNVLCYADMSFAEDLASGWMIAGLALVFHYQVYVYCLSSAIRTLIDARHEPAES
jgi:hypothetical protein